MPRKKALPGMENRAVEELEGLAEEFVSLGEKRRAAKEQLIAAMTRHKKTHYKHGRVEITRTDGTPGVRVKVDREPAPE